MEFVVSANSAMNEVSGGQAAIDKGYYAMVDIAAIGANLTRLMEITAENSL